jgi:flagellar biosynthesis protein FlhG
MTRLNRLQDFEQQRLEQAITEACSEVNILLVDTAMHTGKSSVSSSLATGISLLVVMDATASGITESYALIKRLSLENARHQFEVVINKVTDEQEAMAVFKNMNKVVRAHFNARLEYLGYIPLDAKLKRSAQLGRSVVEAFPAALSTKAYVELAQKLLHLPLVQDESLSGVPFMMQSLMRQLRCGEMSQV